ncbi:hypothetical protein POM88_038330 [Heracleum sosnowskyi]|uniref:Uncharacterized protein n=1 Tax=Heracleum sosnowskyi TaxID=360622 RepID=A0AAD8H8Z1_9APIA|nr:hypothetical protein POM88_038330 [Heracleum sosnowskyi]
MAISKNRGKLLRSSLYTFGCIRSPTDDPEGPNEHQDSGYSRIVYCNQPHLHRNKPLKYSLNHISTTNMVFPLAIVVGLSMAKEGIEDWRRFLQDRKVNLRKIRTREENGEFSDKPWLKIQVGDVVKVEKDQFFPADLFFLSSSYEDGICYVETMNLDGETNLKVKRALEKLTTGSILSIPVKSS